MTDIKQFWEQQHQDRNQALLSGCGMQETIEFLKLDDIIQPGMRVLEVGIGQGYVTRGLAAHHLISAVDISELALDSVRDICENIWLDTEIENLPSDYFDIIICHNVAQHVPTSDLERLLQHLIRSLRPQGVFALEYVRKTGVEDAGIEPSLDMIRTGWLCRSDHLMQNLITRHSGSVDIVRSHDIVHKIISGVTVVHVRKLKYFDQKKIMITGGTGSWGQTLARMLLERYDPKEITIFSRGELQQVLMQRRFQDHRLRFVIGDVRDYDSVRWAMRDVNVVFHLAALKHVPICEDHPQEAIKTNIMGTTNVVNAALENKVAKVIDVSTDKAVEPLNLYGMTKSVGERLMLQANDLGSTTQFVCIRGGNVMGSNGSVVPYFIEQIRSGGPVTITDLGMTRFFLTLEEAIGLLFKAAEHSIGGETFVMNMPACRIRDVAEVLMQSLGRVAVREIGAKPGEKLDEMLISHHEAPLARKFDDNYFVILPFRASPVLLDHYQDSPRFEHSEFSSRTKLMDLPEIKTMLEKGGFL